MSEPQAQPGAVASGWPRLAGLAAGRRLKWSQIQGSAVALTIVAIGAYTSIETPVFLSQQNLLNILSQISVLGIVSVGMTIVMIGGGIDLSVGSLVSLTGVIGGLWIAHGHSLLWVLPATIVIGAAIGSITGLVVAKTRVQPFIITLGGLSLLQGLALMRTHAEQVSLFGGGAFNALGNGTWLGVPIPGVILIGIALLAVVVMSFTRVGRNLYAIGGNETAAYLSGLNVDRYKIATYAALGGLCGLASIILASSISGALPLMGSGIELQSVAAVVIGGVALTGGRGSIAGGLLGVMLLGVIQNSLNLLGIQAFYQQLIIGLVIIVAVISNTASRKR